MSTDDVPEPHVRNADEVTTAVIAAVIPIAEVVGFFDRSFSTLASTLAPQGVTIAGPAFARFHGQPTETADLEVGFPTDRPVAPDGDVRPGTLPGGPVARLVHRGGYDRLGESWMRLQAWIADSDHTAGPDLWEVYVTQPTPDMDPADLRTELNWSLA